MRRSNRASTIKKTLESNDKSALREGSKRRKPLKQLNLPEAIELSSIHREVDTSNKDTSEEERVFSEGEDYWIDASAYEFTDLKLTSPLTPFPQSPSESERWSTSVNHFDLGAEAAPTLGSFPPLWNWMA